MGGGGRGGERGEKKGNVPNGGVRLKKEKGLQPAVEWQGGRKGGVSRGESRRKRGRGEEERGEPS